MPNPHLRLVLQLCMFKEESVGAHTIDSDQLFQCEMELGTKELFLDDVPPCGGHYSNE